MQSAASSAAAATGNVYIPLTAAKTRFGETTVQFGGTSAKIEKVELQEVTVKVSSSEHVLATRDIIEGLMTRFHKKKDRREASSRSLSAWNAFCILHRVAEHRHWRHRL